MGALFGFLASLSITSSEVFGRRITNEIGPIVAASATSLVAAVCALAISVVADGTPIGRDLAFGAVSGLGFGIGMVSYLRGVRVSSSAVVGPIVAALATLIPFVYAAIVDVRPSHLAITGATVTILGLVLVTLGGDAASNVRPGVVFGTMSGLGYGIGTALLIETTSASGSWPVVSQRGVAFAAIVTYAMVRRRPIVPPKRFAGNVLGGGMFAGFASLFLLAGVSANPAAASVTASLFPASGVAAGRLLFGDSVSKAQVLGLVIVIGGIIAIVVG